MNRPGPAARVYDRTTKPNLIDAYGYRHRPARRSHAVEYVCCFALGFVIATAALLAWIVRGL